MTLKQKKSMNEIKFYIEFMRNSKMPFMLKNIADCGKLNKRNFEFYSKIVVLKL